ncbi:MAG TPA: site-specific integrase [Alteromonas sp.]|nr:site-specific integrase [Alteromonas sp.]|tara:strand:- start:42561 stop:43541 length:981 start_codon:yes stop_codon:yes gene_type:complete
MATITKRENGKWQAKCRRKGYQTQSKTFDKKSDAVKWARDIERAMDQSIFQSTSAAESLTMLEGLERYWTEVLIRKKSADNLHYMVDRLKKVFKSFRLIDLSVESVREYKAYRLEQVSGDTVRKEMNLLRRFVDYAMREWQIHLPRGNPLSSVALPVKGKARDRRLKFGEEAKLLNAAKAYGGKIHDIVLLAIETGMRRSEIIGMEWMHFDLKDSTVFLPDTKNGESRTVPLSPKARDLILSQERRFSGKIFDIRGDSVGQAFRRVTSRAGLDDLRFHDLRHEATSRFFEKGLQLMEVSAITGHKDLASLKRYTHLRPADLAKKLA